MTVAPLFAPRPEPRRDHNQRPYVEPPGGGKEVTYTRVTTFAETLDDRFNLEKWKMRMTAIGLADRPDLLLSVTTQRDDKKALDATVEAAQEAAKAKAGANIGTALHRLTELVDIKAELPEVQSEILWSLLAYEKATQHLNMVATERFVVVDELEVAGTFDRIVELSDGRRFIADIKTGRGALWGAATMAVQLACYSRGQAYDLATHQRTPLNVDQDQAIVIHLPQGEATCRLLWLDIRLGWEAALLAHRVRRYRKFAKKGLLTDIAVFQQEGET